MKLEKKHYIIIGVVVALIAIWYFFLRKKKAESSYRTFGASPKAVRGGSSPANKITCRRCWVTTEDCSGAPAKPCTYTCNWYDDNGAITRTFNSQCTARQAGMAGSTTAHNVVGD
jgi:hypothetical protein